MLQQEIPISPFRIKVDPSHDAAKVRAEGPGLSKTGELINYELLLSVNKVTKYGRK